MQGGGGFSFYLVPPSFLSLTSSLSHTQRLSVKGDKQLLRASTRECGLGAETGQAVAHYASAMNTVESSSAEILLGIFRFRHSLQSLSSLSTISHRTQGPPLATSSSSYGRTAAISTSTTAYLSPDLNSPPPPFVFLFFCFLLFFFCLPPFSFSPIRVVSYMLVSHSRCRRMFGPATEAALHAKFAD